MKGKGPENHWENSSQAKTPGVCNLLSAGETGGRRGGGGGEKKT